MTPEFTTIQLEIICQCSAYGRRKRLRGEGQSLFEHADDSTTVVHLATVYMIFFIDFAASLSNVGNGIQNGKNTKKNRKPAHFFNYITHLLT